MELHDIHGHQDTPIHHLAEYLEMKVQQGEMTIDEAFDRIDLFIETNRDLAHDDDEDLIRRLFTYED